MLTGVSFPERRRLRFVKRGRSRGRIRHAGARRDERSPFLGEHFACKYQFDSVVGPAKTFLNSRIDYVFYKRRISKKHRLLELMRERTYDPQNFRFHVAGSDREDGISLRRKVPAARGREKSADPRAERKANDGERALLSDSRSCRRRFARSDGQSSVRPRPSARGQNVGSPVDPEDTAIVSAIASVPPGHRSASGYLLRWFPSSREAVGRSPRAYQRLSGRCRVHKKRAVHRHVPRGPSKELDRAVRWVDRAMGFEEFVERRRQKRIPRRLNSIASLVVHGTVCAAAAFRQVFVAARSAVGVFRRASTVPVAEADALRSRRILFSKTRRHARRPSVRHSRRGNRHRGSYSSWCYRPRTP